MSVKGGGVGVKEGCKDKNKMIYEVCEGGKGTRSRLRKNVCVSE